MSVNSGEGRAYSLPKGRDAAGVLGLDMGGVPCHQWRAPQREAPDVYLGAPDGRSVFVKLTT